MRNSLEINRDKFLKSLGVSFLLPFSFGEGIDEDKGVFGSFFNVKEFGALGDGFSDDSEAFQKSINKAGINGGIVFVPSGQYVINKSIFIKKGVSIVGVANMIQYSDTLKGSVILAKVGKNNENSSALFELGSSCSVSGITVFYPDQKVNNILPYSWTFHLQGNDNTLENITLINSYNGICVGPESNVRHRLKNIFGCVLRRGIKIDGCTDIGRIEDIQFHGHWWWDENVGGDVELVNNYMINNLEAFIFGRTDWEYVLNTFVFPVKIGYHFIKTEKGACNGQFLGIGADMAQNCIVVDEIQYMGLLITNGQFVAFKGKEPTEIIITKNCKGQVRLVNCAFWGPAKQNIISHSNSYVSLTDCYFSSDIKSKEPLVQAYNGRIQVTACSFDGDKPSIKIGMDVKHAIISNNMAEYGIKIENEIGERAIISSNEDH